MHLPTKIYTDSIAGRWLCFVTCQCGEFFIQTSIVEDNTLQFALHNALQEYWDHRTSREGVSQC